MHLLVEKFEEGESPLDCIMREYYEETGLQLINPRLQGMSYWKDSTEGNNFCVCCRGLLKEN